MNQADGAHPMNHVGLKAVSRTVADLMKADLLVGKKIPQRLWAGWYASSGQQVPTIKSI